jgi:hypothetical protein
MKFWILVMAAAVLLVLSLARERFEPTSKIKAAPYNDTEKVRIYSMLSQSSAATLMTKAKSEAPTERDDTKLAAKAAGYITPAMESFYTTVYVPGTKTLTTATVDKFMEGRTGPLKDIEKEAVTAYFINQSSIASSGYLDILAGVGQEAQYRAETNRPAPVCPLGTIRRSDDKKCVSTTATATPSCPAGYRLRDSDKMCLRIGGTETVDPSCPSGFEYNAVATRCDTRPVDPTCPGGYTYKSERCEADAAGSAASGSAASGSAASGSAASGSAASGSAASGSAASGSAASGSASGAASGASSGATGGGTGGTTGGSSTSSWGPTTGGSSNRLRQVFGPQFTGGGGELTGSTGDSSQTNVYPELLGGLIDSSSRIPGAGITSPSKNYTMTKDGTLPPRNTTGSDPMSQFFPFSRTPGDMDVIPDPYRVAKTFSPSSYSSKTEPVPFLTDFSAFQR